MATAYSISMDNSNPPPNSMGIIDCNGSINQSINTDPMNNEKNNISRLSQECWT